MFGLKGFSRFFLLAGLALFTVGCSVAPAASAQQPGTPVVNNTPAGQTPTGQTAGSNSSRGITVVGTGKTSGSPDMAQIHIGIDTQDPAAQKAVSDNQTRMNALLVKLKELGIADNDIRTSNYNVSTQRPPMPVEPGTQGSALTPIYFVSNQVQVTIRDVTKLGSVLDQVVEVGANNIYGVNFGFSDPSKLEAEARAKAVEDARNRAQSLAQLEGVTLGAIVNVSEVINAFPGPVYQSATGLGGSGTPIQPGALEIVVNIQVTYTIQ